jgi:hypothetical protein
VVSTTPRPLYPQERPSTQYTGGWVGPRADLDMREKSCLTGIRSPDRPARSQSLYQLSYPANISVLLVFKILFTTLANIINFQTAPIILIHPVPQYLTTYGGIQQFWHMIRDLVYYVLQLYLQHLLAWKPEEGHCIKAETCHLKCNKHLFLWFPSRCAKISKPAIYI